MFINRLNFCLLVVLVRWSDMAGLQKHECECKIRYQVENGLMSFSNFQVTIQNADDKKDYCDFRCVDECNKLAIGYLSGGFDELGQTGLNKICQETFPDSTLNRKGISVVNLWDLTRCAKDEFLIENGICCRHCDCRLVYRIPRSDDDIAIKDLSDEMQTFFSTIQGFKCADSDHDRDCENYCRERVSKLTKYKPLVDSPRDVYTPLVNRKDSNEFCQILRTVSGFERINAPGVDLAIQISTGPNRNVHMYKEIWLHGICCRRTCYCSVMYRHKNNDLEIEIPLSDRLRQRPDSYYCADEMTECFEDCKLAVGDYFISEMIKEPKWPTEYTDIISDFTTARRFCYVTQRDFLNPGIYLWLKYSVAESSLDLAKLVYPFSQEIFLGNLCCQTASKIDYFPFNKCQSWDINDYQTIIDSLIPFVPS